MTQHSDALDLQQSFFKSDNPRRIAKSLKKSAEKSAFWCEDPLVEEKDEEYTVDVPDLEEVDVEKEELVVDGDRAVYRTVTIKETRQKTKEVPVFNVDGSPMMTPATPDQPARPATADQPARPAIPGRPARQMMHAVALTAVETRVRKVRLPVLDENGAPATRLGIRYEELSILMHDWQRREIARLWARLNAS